MLLETTMKHDETVRKTAAEVEPLTSTNIDGALRGNWWGIDGGITKSCLYTPRMTWWGIIKYYKIMVHTPQMIKYTLKTL